MYEIQIWLFVSESSYCRMCYMDTKDTFKLSFLYSELEFYM